MRAWLVLVAFVAFHEFQTVTAHPNATYSLEDIPEYEVLNFPSKSEITTYRNSKGNKRKQNEKPQEQQTSAGPCKCLYGQCTCCTGPVLDLIQQKACVKIVYTPQDFAFDYSMMLNNRVMYQNRFSGKNPPPACFNLPRFTSLKVCARFSNIYFVGRNLHMCLGLNGRWESFELFAFQFDCLRMGSEGVYVLKPEDGGYPEGVGGGLDAIIDSGDDIDDYDENLVRSAQVNILTKIRKLNNTSIKRRRKH